MREAYRKQSEVVFRLQGDRQALESEIHRLWTAPSSQSRSRRLDAARQRLDSLDRRIRRERAALARIVREARQAGAEPGWFRGLGPD